MKFCEIVFYYELLSRTSHYIQDWSLYARPVTICKTGHYMCFAFADFSSSMINRTRLESMLVAALIVTPSASQNSVCIHIHRGVYALSSLVYCSVLASIY